MKTEIVEIIQVDLNKGDKAGEYYFRNKVSEVLKHLVREGRKENERLMRLLKLGSKNELEARELMDHEYFSSNFKIKNKSNEFENKDM